MTDSPFLEDDSSLTGERLSLRWIPVDLIPSLLWEQNPKLHNIGELWESIVKFGFIDPAKFDTNLTNKEGTKGALIFGNGRSEALWWGYQEFKAGRWDGDIPRGIGADSAGIWFMPVKVGIDADSEAAAADFGIFHNSSTMLGGDFADGDIWSLYDKEALAKVGKLIQADKSFEPLSMTGEEVDALLNFLGGDKTEDEPGGDPEAALNRAEELREKYQVERGQLWIIGDHRLLCGDAYLPENLERLLGGESPDLLHTDPPYGIDIVKPRKGDQTASVGGVSSQHISNFGKGAVGGSKAFGSNGRADRKGDNHVAFGRSSNLKTENTVAFRSTKTGHVQHGAPSKNQIIQSNMYPVIEGDDTPFEPEFLLELAPIVVLWGANYYAQKLPVSSGWIVWDKRENITRNNFADCEIAWTNQDDPARIFYHLWNGLHKGSQHGERRVHPTEKPVALFAEIGNLLAPQGLWLDLFAGSGAQIVAAQQNNARCFAIEFEPLYVATILERMSNLGLEPRLEETPSN